MEKRRTKPAKVIDLNEWKTAREQARGEERVLLTPLLFDETTVMRQEDDERPVVIILSPGVGVTLSRREAKKLAETLVRAANHRRRRHD